MTRMTTLVREGEEGEAAAGVRAVVVVTTRMMTMAVGEVGMTTRMTIMVVGEVGTMTGMTTMVGEGEEGAGVEVATTMTMMTVAVEVMDEEHVRGDSHP
jgi:hypothetical protein